MARTVAGDDGNRDSARVGKLEGSGRLAGFRNSGDGYHREHGQEVGEDARFRNSDDGYQSGARTQTGGDFDHGRS